jgi:hypothetical protein
MGVRRSLAGGLLLFAAMFALGLLPACAENHDDDDEADVSDDDNDNDAAADDDDNDNDDDNNDDDESPTSPYIDSDGYFVLDGARTLVLGAEEPPIWIAFEPLQPYPEIVDEFVDLCVQSHINLIVFYKWVPWPREFIQRLADAGIWVGVQVAEAKQNLWGFSQTGGAIGTLQDEEHQQEQIDLINAKVPFYADLPNVAFWWIGGEFVEPFFYFDGGARLKQIVQRYVDAIHELDPLRRPITCSQHLLEMMLCSTDGKRTCLDLAGITDFAWFTMATHMHLGDFIPGLSYDLNWLPVLDLMEHQAALRPLLREINHVNHGRAFYLGSWSTMSPAHGPCGPSADLTRTQWEHLTSAASYSGGAYWNFGDHIQPSDFPHGLVELQDGLLAETENMIGLAQGYAASGEISLDFPAVHEP